MQRKASVHFKPVSNIRFAVSHSERTDLSEPAYLLPMEHQLPNVVVAGSLSENELSALFIKQKEGMTGQAKARGSSPFWEGVVVLGDTDAKAQTANLLAWKKEYEKATWHKVLHMSIHLDEGYIDTTGKPQYNPHAHVIVSRMDSKNRVIKLERKELATVQDLTAIALKMERGSTLAERGGRRGRAHIGHREYRAQAEESRLDLDVEKGKTSREARLVDVNIERANSAREKLKTAEATISTQAAQIAQLNELYRLARQALKDSGTAKQADYQNLKKEHEAEMADQKKANQATLAKLAIAKVELTETKEKMIAVTQENQTLKAENAKLEADKARFAAMATAYQADVAAGIPAHLVVPSHSQKAAKTPVEAPKSQSHPIPSPAPQKPAKQALNVILTMSTGSAAFEDLGRNQETANVVRGAADFIAQGWDGRPFDLKDTNGNKVGKAESAVEGGNFPTPPDGGILLVVPPNKDLVGTLRGVADKLETIVLAGVQSIKDAVGNVIAQLFYKPTLAEKTAQAHQPDKSKNLDFDR